MYAIYLVTVCFSVTMVIVVILDFPILPFLPSPNVTTSCCSLNLSFICTVFAVSLFYAWNLSATSDLVPSMIYYHLADEVDNINRSIPDGLDVENLPTSTYIAVELVEEAFNMRRTWLYYEAVRGLIDEANSLFGLMLVLNHGAMFFVASSNVFAILRWYQGMSWLLLLVYGTNATSTILRVTSTIMLCSRLSQARDRLQKKISGFLVRSLDGHLLSLSFFMRVQDQGTVASPVGLYSIKPSILLTLLSLLVTYLIVMLQSSDGSSFTAFGNFTGLITGSLFYDTSMYQ